MTQHPEDEGLIVGNEVLTLDHRIEPQACLLSLSRRNVDLELGGDSNPPTLTAGDKRQDGVVKSLVPHIRLHHERRPYLPSRLVAVWKIHEYDVTALDLHDSLRGSSSL